LDEIPEAITALAPPDFGGMIVAGPIAGRQGAPR
jgi:hypothetical protein